jgi:hypothetical protein
MEHRLTLTACCSFVLATTLQLFCDYHQTNKATQGLCLWLMQSPQSTPVVSSMQAVNVTRGYAPFIPYWDRVVSMATATAVPGAPAAGIAQQLLHEPHMAFVCR